ncbi:MAG: restriction endonuclease [Gaiellaceae bacterium]
MDGPDFERTIAELFVLLGYDVERIGGFDKGADLVLTMDGERTAVQAKRYSIAVGIKAVRQLLDGRTRYGCTQGLVVTNSFFTDPAIECAEVHKITLWDRHELGEYLAGDPPEIDVAVCADCGASVSAGVTKFCLDQPGRFLGNVYCPKHQARSQRRAA